MRSNELKQTINEQLFVPLDDNLVERLHEVTDLLIAETDTDTVTVENYVKDFFANTVNISFHDLFMARYSELYNEELQLPSIVFLILVIYFVRQTLLKEFIDSHQKLQFSYIVKNYAVLKKGKWNDLICTNWIIEIYNYCDCNTCKPINSKVNYGDLIDKVLSCDSWGETGLDINDEDTYNQLKSLIIAGIRGSFNTFVNNDLFKNISSPFAQMYLLTRMMVMEWNWKYIAISPISVLKEVLGDNVNRRKNLNNIADDVRLAIPKSLIIIPAMESSVLLKRIHENKICDIEKCIFSTIEFGTCLYYEMLLESYNK